MRPTFDNLVAHVYSTPAFKALEALQRKNSTQDMVTIHFFHATVEDINASIARTVAFYAGK